MQMIFSHSHKALRVICKGFPEPSVERHVDATATTSVSVGASTYPTLRTIVSRKRRRHMDRRAH